MTELSNAYTHTADAPTGPDVSRVERALLCELFTAVGPSAPTLCEGWDTHHLAAHLVGREGNPLRQVASAVPALSDRSVDTLVARHDFPSLVEMVRTGPPRLTLFSVGKLEPLLNIVEYFIHHEDVRRAVDGWEPRVLPHWAEGQLWARTVGFAKLTWWRKPTALVLERADTGQQAHISKGEGEVVLRGMPSEISLYLSGRPAVARVDVTGDTESGAAA